MSAGGGRGTAGLRPEFSRPVEVGRIGAAGLDVTVGARATECTALAARMRIPAVLECACRFRLTAADSGGVVLAEGHLRALVVRVCVLTLDEFEMATEEQFRLRFVPAGWESDDNDPESDDEVPYDSGTIDLGEAATEQLALALDPYPKKPGATLPGADEGPPN